MKLNTDLNVHNWLTANKLALLNKEKTEYMIIGSIDKDWMYFLTMILM